MSTPAQYIDERDEDEVRRAYRSMFEEEDAALGRSVPPPAQPSAPLAEPTAPTRADERSENDVRGAYRSMFEDEDLENLRRGRAVQGVASKYTPDAYAEAVKLGREFGIDAKTVADNPEPYRQESKRRATQGTLTDAPATREWLNNLDNAAVAQDDIENLVQIERTMGEVSALTRAGDIARSPLSGFVQFFGMGASGIAEGLDVYNRGIGDATRSLFESLGIPEVGNVLTTPVPDWLDARKALAWYGANAEAVAKDIAPPVERQNIATEVAGALGQIAGTVATSFAGAPAALALLFGQGADIQYDRATEAGATQEQKDRATLWGAIITGVTEKYQLDELLKLVPAGVRLAVFDRIKRAAMAALGEGVQEITEGIGQDIAAKTIYDPEAKLFDVASLAREGTVAGYAGGIAKLLIDSAIPGKSRGNALSPEDMRALQDASRALDGHRAGLFAAELSKRAGQSSVAEKSPEQLETLAAAIKEKNGVEFAYVDPAAFRTLYQSDDEANNAANSYSGGERTYYEAAISGTPIAVPIEKYISRIAPKVGDAKVEGKSFTDFVAFDPEGLNGNEAAEQRTALEAEAKKAAEQITEQGGTDTSQAVFDDIRAQLIAAGMEPTTADFNAAQMQATFRVFAARSGTDALQLYQRSGVKVQNRFADDPPEGTTELTQGAAVTDSPEFQQWFGESKAVDEGGKPLVVYHGTKAEQDFTEFGDQAIGSQSGNKGIFGTGFYFTEDARVASEYAGNRNQRADGPARVMPVYLAMRNPFVWSERTPLEKFREFVGSLQGVTAEDIAASQARSLTHSTGFTSRVSTVQAVIESVGVERFTQLLKQNGYDGVIMETPSAYRDRNSTREYVAFEPSQIKSATGNRGTFDPNSDNILFQSEDAALPFYSALTRAAENATLNKAPAEQWKATLRNTPGVKPEEIEWLGVEEWLESLGRPATKAEVVEYLKANQIEIEEVERGSLPAKQLAALARNIEGVGLSELVGDGEGYYVNGEPDVSEMRFNFDATSLDEDGNEQDLRLKVIVQNLEAMRNGYSVGNWSGADVGTVFARIKFPDGRIIDASADFSLDEEDGTIGDLEATSVNRWESEDEFNESEYEAIAEAVQAIELRENRELNPKVQEDIDDYERQMAKAAESLNEGDVEDARNHLEDARSYEREYGDSEGPAWQALDALKEADTKYGTWVTPGGDNYKELLLTLPEKQPSQDEQAQLKLRERLADVENEAQSLRTIYPIISERPPEIQARIESARDEALRLREALRPPKAKVFTSSHWDEKNILAHVRFNERTDADGKRVLFIEEIQSDWHQAGRREGYAGDKPPDYTPVDTLPEGWTWAISEGNNIALSEGERWIVTKRAPALDPNQTQEEYLRALNVRAVEMYNEVQQRKMLADFNDKVPDAPLKTTWPELAFKRMIRYAADNDFERIAWTPGKVQAERYDLRKQVDQITVERLDDGFEYTATKDDQQRALAAGKVANVDALADQIGKELADKAATLKPGERSDYRDEDLRVGGAGMVGFYDRMLPSTVNKLVKKWGAKVGRTTIDTTPPPRAYLRPDGTRAAYTPSKDAFTAMSVDVTPAMKAAALAGLPLFQRGAPTIEGTGNKRGSITWGTDRKFTINLFEKRDLSTFLHESGHLYLEIMADLAEMPDAPAQIRDDFQTLLKWFGVKDRASIGVDQHEQFARGFEAYLAEGKAPSAELQPVFFRFRQWMLAVYKQIKALGSSPGSIGAALNVTLTDEVRSVMDRMLATDEEIDASERQQQYAPIFLSAEDAGYSAPEWEAYRETVDRAHRESVDELTSRAVQELYRKKRQWWKDERAKLVKEITAEVNRAPLYNAIAFLTKGKQADGSPLPEGTVTFKISRADITERFGEGAYKSLPRGSTTAGPEGLTIDSAAQMLGFSSGNQLVRSLIAAPPKKVAIEQLADARMRERHGDMMQDGSMVEQAIEAVHTEARAKVLAAELKALRRKQAEVKDFVQGATDAENLARRQAREANEASLPKRDEMAQIRLAAQRAIASKKIRTISPQLYRRAEVKAAKLAFEMAGKGKYEEAYIAKRQQILNYELFRAAVAAQAKIKSNVEYMRRFAKKSVRKKLASAKGQYLEQIDALLARFDFTPQPANADLKRDALAKWIEAQVAAGREVAVPQWLIDESRRTPYKELMAAELDGLVDAAKNIEHLANTKDRMLSARGEAKFQEVKAKLDARARQSMKGGRAPPISPYHESLFKRSGRFLRGFLDSNLRAETIVEWLDDGKSGPWHEYFYELANKAEYARESMRTEVLEPMRKLARAIDRKRRAELEEKVYIPSLGASYDRRMLISVVLNMGNASNLERLLKGGFRDPARGNSVRKFTPQSLAEIQDALNAKDWQFIQAMWTTAESLWPRMVEFQKRMGGLVPEKIPATPIVTRFGTFTGGYWPAVRDRYADALGERQAEPTDPVGMLVGGVLTTASTNKSALQERTGARGPMLLDYSAVMGRHMDQVITDITHREFAIQATRILEDGDLRLTLQDAVGAVGWESLRGMVRGAIQQDSGFAHAATQDIENMRSRMLSNLAVAALGFKVVTAFGNLVMAPIQAAARVSPKYILKGIGMFMNQRGAARAFVDEHSEMMRNRAQNMDASFTVIREKIEGRSGVWADAQRAAMAVHAAADYMATTGVWLGAYHQAIATENADHAEAVRLADKAIRMTQTAGAPKDLSAFERNPAYREFKLFLGPMVIMQNRMREAVRKRGVVKSWPQAFGTLMAAYFLPAIIWDIVTGRGPDDDDDDGEVWNDEFLPYALRKLVAYPLNTLPYLRDAMTLAERKWAGKFAEARMTPAADAVWLALKAFDTITEETMGDDDIDYGKITKATVRAAGPLFGLPGSAQLDVTGTYIYDLLSGEYDPESPADLKYFLIRRPADK